MKYCPNCHFLLTVQRKSKKSHSFKAKRKIRDVRRNNEPISVWFWKMLDIKREDECWEWQGYRQGLVGFEYGFVQSKELGSNKRVGAAHRVAYELTTGEKLSFSDHILHSCDNPPCCNPKHLSKGDATTNAKDTMAKSRHPHGETMHNARLTVEDVLRIRNCDATNKQLARTFGVSYNTITNIRKFKSWKHVPPEEGVVPWVYKPGVQSFE